MPMPLELDIYRTIAFFSYFRYPLTSFEVWKWLMEPRASYTLDAVMNTLRHSEWLAERIRAKNGFYGIETESRGINAQIQLRHDRFLNAVKKYKKMKRVLAYVARLPGVQGVAVCNSLAIHYTREESDIDLFIITKPGHVWRTRFFAVLPLILFKQRPGEAKKNPVDISFYVTTEAMNLMKLKSGAEDPYLAWWTCALSPVYGREEVFQPFARHNAWAKIVFPNSRLPKRPVGSRCGKIFSLPTVFFSEQLLEHVQRKKFPEEIAHADETDSHVVISGDMLKFHKNDRRDEILRFLQGRLERAGVDAYEAHH